MPKRRPFHVRFTSSLNRERDRQRRPSARFRSRGLFIDRSLTTGGRVRCFCKCGWEGEKAAKKAGVQNPVVE